MKDLEAKREQYRQLRTLWIAALTKLGKLPENPEENFEFHSTEGNRLKDPEAILNLADDLVREAEDEVARKENEKAARRGPQPGTWAHTARMMAGLFPEGPGNGMDWDQWKDQMKEGDY